MIDREKIINSVLENKIIAIMRGVDKDLSLRVADALFAGGVKMVEVTFNQKDPSSFKDTASSIKAIAEKYEEKMLVGAGTVINNQQLDMAYDAGAMYIISPNVNIDVIRHTRELGCVSMPGAFTPSEIITAYDTGADFVKLFPAGNLGPSYIKAIRGPISHVRLLAVGGVNEENISDFLKAGCCGAGIGGNLVNTKWIEAGEFNKITEVAEKLTAAVR